MRTIFKYIFTPLPPVSFVERRWYERLSFYNRLNLFYRILFKNSFSYNSWKYNLLLVIKHFIVLILFPFYLPIILIFKIFNLKILHVDFAQIGAFIHQVDFLIKENKLNNKPQRLILLAPPILTVNKYLAKIFKKELILSENFFLYLIFYPLMHYNLTSIHPWNSETINKKNTYNLVHKKYRLKTGKYFLNINDNHIPRDNYLNYLSKHNLIEKNFVCIHLRDSSYYNFESCRDVNNKNYASSINYLINKKIPVIRFVHNNSESVKSFDSKFYYEYLVDDDASKTVQYYLIKNSKFIICTQSGIMNFNSILDVPFFLTNAIPINLSGVIKSQDRIIIKKFRNIKSNKFLKIEEIFEKNLHLSPEFNTLENNLEIVENTHNEILNGVQEMLSDVNSVNNFNEDENLNEFKKYHPFIYTDAYIPKNFKI